MNSPDARKDELEQVLGDVIRRRVAGEQIVEATVLAGYPQLLPELEERLRHLRRVEAAVLGEGPGRDLPHLNVPGYELIAELHRGGQGVVYRARQLSTPREVAIKVRRDGPLAGPAERYRFQREITLLAQLRHPNIVAIHDSALAGELQYFVMDLIAGQALDVHCAQLGREPRSVLAIFAAICEAVNAAHLRGVIHRDIKPSNILVDSEGKPHVLDFGLAKSTATDPSEGSSVDCGPPALTCTGQFLGSLPWSSPEQARGDSARVDTRSDVYSIGIMLFQMLTGRFPYDTAGSFRDVLVRIEQAEPVRPRALDRRVGDEVETIVLKCLAKEPERRYSTAGELAADIRRYLTGDAIAAKRDSLSYVLRKQLVRHRGVAALVATGMSILLVSLVTISIFWRDALAKGRVAERALESANLERRIAQAVSDFLNEDLLAAAIPSDKPGRGREVRLRESLIRRRIDSIWRPRLGAGLNSYQKSKRRCAGRSAEYLTTWKNGHRALPSTSERTSC